MSLPTGSRCRSAPVQKAFWLLGDSQIQSSGFRTVSKTNHVASMLHGAAGSSRNSIKIGGNARFAVEVETNVNRPGTMPIYLYFSTI
jgi:hypothetical protein